MSEQGFCIVVLLGRSVSFRRKWLSLKDYEEGEVEEGMRGTPE